MDTSIAAVLFGTTRRKVLSLFFSRPDESFYLRQVARLSGSGMGAVQRELAMLSRAGVLAVERRAAQTLYSANGGCPVFDELKGLVIKTVGLADGLRDALRPLAGRIAVAFVFGSFARAQQQNESDVDVLVVAENVELGELVAAFKPMQARTGREINPMLYSPREFYDKIRARHHFLANVMAAEKLFLIGDKHELERMATQRVAPSAHGGRKRDPRTVRRGGSRPAGLRDARPQR